MADRVLRIVACCLCQLGLFFCCGVASAQSDPSNGTSTSQRADSADWQAIEGTWILESAERDGQDVPSMKGVRYFLEPGLIRWANPAMKSEFTELPLMMGRLLKHVDGDKFETSPIFPPAPSAKLEIAVDGDNMAMMVDGGIGKADLNMTLRRKNNRSPKPPVDKMLKQARESLAKNELEAAYQFAQLQLINYPDSREAAVLLARSRLQSANQQQSGFDATRLRRIRSQAKWALEKYPDEHKLRNEYASFLHRFMLFNEALPEFQTLYNSGEWFDESMLKYAQLLGRAGKRDEAKKILEEMVGYEQGEFTGRERSPGPNSAYLFLAKALEAEGKDEQAHRVVATMIERFPDEPKSHLDYGRFLLTTDMEKARASFQKALEIDPGDRESLLVNIEVGLRDPDAKVDELIDRAFDVVGDETILVVLAATRAGIQKEFTKAITLVDDALKKEPQARALLSLKVQLLAEKGDFAEAYQLIDELPSLGVPKASAQLMKARVLIAAKEFSRATRALAEVQVEGAPRSLQVQVQTMKQLLRAAMDEAAKSNISSSLGEDDLINTDPPPLDSTAPGSGTK